MPFLSRTDLIIRVIERGDKRDNFLERLGILTTIIIMFFNMLLSFLGFNACFLPKLFGLLLPNALFRWEYGGWLSWHVAMDTLVKV